MIDFALDVLSDLSLAITSYKNSDFKGQDIRAFIALYDAIRLVTVTAKKLTLGFSNYTSSCESNFDVSILRKLIRNFSLSIYKLVDTFRKFGLRNGIPLECFQPELARNFIPVGTIKSLFCRSLIEIAIPDICLDHSLPTTERDYLLRIIDYQKYQYSVAEVQKQWHNFFSYYGISDILLQTASVPVKFTNLPKKWLSESGTYNNYKHQIPFIKKEEVEINEAFIRSILDFRILTFTDIDELQDQIQQDAISLQKLRRNLVTLEEFLTNSFSMSDFF
ncbi:hypothetical protein ACQFX9_06080 [Aliinostoc sp. HNIBRCY26]|uniref:hypothetical protein n=1 Tax=Aliinostoc sp. HNIBRCY26 TaxID=3418997 RepID=UPI003D044611